MPINCSKTYLHPDLDRVKCKVTDDGKYAELPQQLRDAIRTLYDYVYVLRDELCAQKAAANEIVFDFGLGATPSAVTIGDETQYPALGADITVSQWRAKFFSAPIGSAFTADIKLNGKLLFTATIPDGATMDATGKFPQMTIRPQDNVFGKATAVGTGTAATGVSIVAF